jgi:enoyl-CoA hydratase/carnithine racemase
MPAEPTSVALDLVAPGVAEITLTSPRHNILGEAAQARLEEICVELAGRPDLRAVLIRSLAPAFSVGADIHEIAEGGDPWAGRGLAEHWTTRLAGLPALTIAVVEGACLGGGLELALCADVRLAGPAATFGFPEARLGVIPGLGGTVRLPRLVGPAWAGLLLATGASIDAATAARIGLVQEVAEAPYDLARHWLAEAERAAPLAGRAALRLVREAADQHAEKAAWQGLSRTRDAAEGRLAFLAKRPPAFRGE